MDEVVRVHDTDGAAGMGRGVVQVAESAPDQPDALPACTSKVSCEPPESPELVFDVPICCDHCPAPSWPPRSYLTRYFVAPDTADHDQVIELEPAVHDTVGPAGIVVQVAESEPDHPAELPAWTNNVALVPASRLLRVLDRGVCSTHGDKNP